jgi:hypothetical protein
MTSNVKALRALAAARRSLDELESELRSSAVVREHSIASAERFVLASLRETDGLSTSRLRRWASSRRLSSEAVSRAIERLHTANRIRFVDGPRKAKLWHLAETSEASPTNPACLGQGDPQALDDSAGIPEAQPAIPMPQNAAGAVESAADATESHEETAHVD